MQAYLFSYRRSVTLFFTHIIQTVYSNKDFFIRIFMFQIKYTVSLYEFPVSIVEVKWLIQSTVFTRKPIEKNVFSKLVDKGFIFECIRPYVGIILPLSTYILFEGRPFCCKVWILCNIAYITENSVYVCYLDMVNYKLWYRIRSAYIPTL